MRLVLITQICDNVSHNFVFILLKHIYNIVFMHKLSKTRVKFGDVEKENVSFGVKKRKCAS